MRPARAYFVDDEPKPRRSRSMITLGEHDIGLLAIEWDTLQRRAFDLKAKRARCVCLEEDSREYDPPCWKQYDENAEPLKVENYCPPCKSREFYHREYRAVKKQAGAALRKLRYWIRKGE